MQNRVELKRYIRFQLSQLSARNAEHEFEHLAFELARARVAPNLLPATGPVQAGGDQGRDFESYRTYLRGSSIAGSIFTSLIDDNIIVGARTLNKNTGPKIKSDLQTIFGTGEKPTHVAYFCEPDLPVAQRHALKEHCQESYNATLDIFDGQAIADMLADRATAWIAEQYLDLPANVWPETSLDERYITARERWLTQREPPRNYADFLDVKAGLRTATRQDEAKRDLGGWIEVMQGFLVDPIPDRLVQKARYEISVAELRGRGSLDPALPLLRQFFEVVTCDRAPAELLDAAVLIVYVWGSTFHGQGSIAPETLAAWVAKIDMVLADALKDAQSHGDRCLLLEAQAMLAFIPRQADAGPGDGLDRFFERWHAVISEVRETPLFPIIHIADIFEFATSLIEPDDRLRSLTSQVDALVAERAGKGAVADLARRRAIVHLEADRHVAAIDELHRVKIESFTGEHIEGSILSMLLLSECYEALELNLASRYCAAGALYASLHVEDEDVKRRISQAAFQVAETFYAAGEGLTYFHSLGTALIAHQGMAAEPSDWTKHPQLRRALTHAVILRGVAGKIAPEMISHIDAAIASWPLPKEERDAFIASSEGDEWSELTTEQVERKIARDLGQNPFGDVGADRSVTWSALGVIWIVRSAADRDTWLAALEVVAALQIMQVEFADVDLLVIPSQAIIEVEVRDITIPECLQQREYPNFCV